MDTRCKDCGKALEQQAEKALSGEWAMVWADAEGDWVCEKTGDEHVAERGVTS